MTVESPVPEMPVIALRDVHLTDQAQAELQSLPYGSLKQITCRVRNHLVELTGTVASYYEKQLAQERLKSCLGTGVRIVNELLVRAQRKEPS